MSLLPDSDDAESDQERLGRKKRKAKRVENWFKRRGRHGAMEDVPRRFDYPTKWIPEYMMSNIEQQGLLRWEGPVERLNRFREVYGDLAKAVIGDDYRILSSMTEEVFSTLQAYAVKENAQHGSNLDQAAMKLIAEMVPGLQVDLVDDSGNLKLIMLDDSDARGRDRYSVVPRENPIVLRHSNLKGPVMILTLRTEFADMTNTKSVILATRSDESISTLLNILNDVKRACRKAHRGSRVIEVYGGENIPLPPSSWSNWDSVFLSADVTKKVRDDLDFFINNRKLFEEVGLPYKRGFLFCGPPGNGKTTICRTVATSMDFACYAFDFSNDNFGNSNLTEAFKMATANAPSVFFLEDIDRLYDPEDKNEKSNVTLDHLLNCLDGMVVNDGLVVIATANNPDRLDPAIRARPGRFDQVVTIGNPDDQLRHRYLTHLFRKMNLEAGTIDMMVGETAGMSMAFLKEIFVVTARTCVMANSKDVTLVLAEQAVLEVVSQYGDTKASKAGFGPRR